MSHFNVLVIGDNVDEQMAPFQESLDVEEAVEDCYCCDDFENADPACEDCGGGGAYAYWYNPNAKYESYVVGGTWSGFFKLKKTEFNFDIVFKRDIDFDAMRLAREEKVRERYATYLHMVSDLTVNPPMNRNPQEIRESLAVMFDFPDGLETAILDVHETVTNAILKDGVWYQAGQIGWFGVYSGGSKADNWQEQWNTLFATVGEKECITIVDCRI